MPFAIGIDLGGTHIKAVAVTPEGEPLGQATDRTDDETGAWGERINALIAELEAEQGHQAEWIGLAAPGLAAPDGSRIIWMQGRMDAIQGLVWTDFLNASKPVPVINDAHAALLGEAWKGAAAGCRNVFLLTLGTGVGGGALVEGRLLKGHIGRGGHLGHLSLNPDGDKDITGAPGSLEDVIGECTLLKRSGGRFASTEELVRAHLSGDEAASRVWLQSVKALAAGIVGLVNVLDPQIVILGGGISKAGAALLEPLLKWMDEWEWRPTGGQVRIVTASLGEWAGAYGAACNALMVNGEVDL
jgi:glucokinase